MIETWIRPMTVGGNEISAEHQAAAWAAWVRRGGTGYSSLAAELRRVGVPDEGIYTLAEAAVRMLQRARKAGVVLYRRRKWELTP